MSWIAGRVPRKGTWVSSAPAERAAMLPAKCGVEPAAGEPKLAAPGFCLHHLKKSAMVVTLAGTMGPTANARSNTPPMDTGTKSATGS